MSCYNWSFTYEAFMKVFTDLNKISMDQFSFYRQMAQNFVDIDYYFGGLPFMQRENIAMLVLAHVLSLTLRGSNGGVGALTNASEGSVSIGFQGVHNYNWWKQTPYGDMFWSILSRYTSPTLVSGDTGCWL